MIDSDFLEMLVHLCDIRRSTSDVVEDKNLVTYYRPVAQAVKCRRTVLKVSSRVSAAGIIVNADYKFFFLPFSEIESQVDGPPLREGDILVDQDEVVYDVTGVEPYDDEDEPHHVEVYVTKRPAQEEQWG